MTRTLVDKWLMIDDGDDDDDDDDDDGDGVLIMV
jgi:hypothetical protein